MVLGTWGGDYSKLLTQNVETPLLKPKGIEVVHDIAGDSQRRAKLIAEQRLPRGTTDLQALSAAGSREMFNAGVLETIDYTKIPNAPNLLAPMKTPYSVGHIYSGQVILYNPAMISPAPTSYNDLWDPKHAGKVGVIDIQYVGTLEAAALIAGGSMENLEPAKAKLMELRKLGLKMYPTNEAMAQALKTGEVGLCIMWKARGVMWQNAGVPVQTVAPKEGVILYVSDFVIPKNAPNKAAAYAYLDAMLAPSAQIGVRRDHGLQPHRDQRQGARRGRQARRLHQGRAGAAASRPTTTTSPRTTASSRSGGTRSSRPDGAPRRPVAGALLGPATLAVVLGLAGAAGASSFATA